MVIFTLILFIYVQHQIQPHPKPVASLGQRRANFGEIPETAKIDAGYRYHEGFSELPTTMLFPVGRSDQRYFFNQFMDDSSSRDKYVLAFETKRNGVIYPEWEVQLDEKEVAPTTLANLSKSFGTVERMLAKSGLYVRKPIPAKAMKKLKMVEGLAGYEFIVSSFSYYFVYPDGTTSASRRWYYDDPLPVSPEEQKALTRAKLKSKHANYKQKQLSS